MERHGKPAFVVRWPFLLLGILTWSVIVAAGCLAWWLR